MSMLTPPGMRGRKYRITGNRYPRMRPRRRRRRNVLAVVAAAALVGLLSYGTLQLVGVFTAEDDEGTGPASAEAGASRPGHCAPPAGDSDQPDLPAVLPEPGAITVNVYNATTRTGLAQDTADALALRGFIIGEVTNAPARLDGKVEEPGLLLATTRAVESGAVAVVGTHLEGAETGEPKASGDPAEVDLVLGRGFTALLTPPEAKDALAELTKPSPSPGERRTPAAC